MRTVFADSFYFFALLNPRDGAHERVAAFTRAYGGRMITTAWVLTEVADGMAAPATRVAFLPFLEQLRTDPDVTALPPEAGWFDAGLELYANRPDKSWSLTDCISFVVMHREGITEALTGDRHFEQAGFQALFK